MVKGRVLQGLILLVGFSAGVALGPRFADFAWAQQNGCAPIEIMTNDGTETNDVAVDLPGDDLCTFFLSGAAPFLRDTGSDAPATGTWEFDCL